jgi:hypothetical protein
VKKKGGKEKKKVKKKRTLKKKNKPKLEQLVRVCHVGRSVRQRAEDKTGVVILADNRLTESQHGKGNFEEELIKVGGDGEVGGKG